MNKASLKNAVAVGLFCSLAGMVTAPFAQAYDFTRDLQMGMSGEDVRQLQIILNSDPDTQIATDGPGAPGQETYYFGPLTETALEKFLAKKSTELSNQVSMMTEDAAPSALTDEADLTSATANAPIGGSRTSSSTKCSSSTLPVVGDTFVTKGSFTVRNGADKNYSALGKQTDGVSATIIAGPVIQNGLHWYQVNYATGTDGWTRAVVLKDHMVTVPVHTVCKTERPEHTATSTPATHATSTVHQGGWGNGSSTHDSDRPDPIVKHPVTQPTIPVVPVVVTPAKATNPTNPVKSEGKSGSDANPKPKQKPGDLTETNTKDNTTVLDNMKGRGQTTPTGSKMPGIGNTPVGGGSDSNQTKPTVVKPTFTTDILKLVDTVVKNAIIKSSAGSDHKDRFEPKTPTKTVVTPGSDHQGHEPTKPSVVVGGGVKAAVGTGVKAAGTVQTVTQTTQKKEIPGASSKVVDSRR